MWPTGFGASRIAHHLNSANAEGFTCKSMIGLYRIDFATALTRRIPIRNDLDFDVLDDVRLRIFRISEKPSSARTATKS